MDTFLENSIILSILFGVWIAVCLTVAICGKLVQIHRCVQSLCFGWSAAAQEDSQSKEEHESIKGE